MPGTDNAYNITVGTDSSSGVTFSNGTYTATADDAVINITDLENALTNGPVTISAGTGGDQEGGITFDTPLTSTATNSLTLEPAPPASGAGVLFDSDDGPSLGGDLVIDGDGEAYGAIAGAGGLVMNGPGTFQLASSSPDTYGGSTTVNGGTLQTFAVGALPSSTDLTIANAAGATLDLSGFSQTIGSLAGGGSTGGLVANMSGPPATLTTGGDDASTTYAGDIEDFSGPVSLTKTGTGTFTFSGTDTATGATTVEDGSLNVHGQITASDVALDGGDLTGIGSIDGVTGNTDTATFGSEAPGQFTSTGPVTFGSGDTVLEYLVASPSAAHPLGEYDQLVNTTSGRLTLGGATLQMTAAPGFAPSVGEVFTMFVDDSSHAVSGTFAGMPQGTVSAFPNARMQISYDATGNNVTLTDIGATASTSLMTSSPSPTAYGAPVTLTATVSTGSPNTNTPSGSVTFKDGSQDARDRATERRHGNADHDCAPDRREQRDRGLQRRRRVRRLHLRTRRRERAGPAEQPAAQHLRTERHRRGGGREHAGVQPRRLDRVSASGVHLPVVDRDDAARRRDGSSFKVPAIDEGTTLVCTVTGTNSAGSATAHSAGSPFRCRRSPDARPPPAR